MKHADDKLNMWFSLMTSILVHVAVILLVPITMTHHVTIYPVEFGEISQTFEATRQGSPVGTSAPTPSKSQDTTVQEKAPKTTETGITEAPAPKPAPPLEKEQKPPLPEPAPKKPELPPKEKQEPVKEVGKSTEPEKHAKTEPEIAPQPEPETVATKPIDKPDDVGRVLTGESDETIPIPKAKAAPPESEDTELPTSRPETDGEGEGSDDTEGRSHTGDEIGDKKETKAEGTPKETEEAGPQKPQGHQFGSGESLAVNWVAPRYPKGAQNIDIMGTVELEVTVNKEGKIIHIDILKPSGHDELDEQARMTILARWQFKGINWPFKIRVTVSFRGETDVIVTFGGVTVLEN